jgi:hypothetical protein
LSDLPELVAGARVGPYEVVREIGRGATAIAYFARDPAGNEVAVKVRRRGVPAADRRFLREFESMRALRHPGVVRVFDAGIDERNVWFSMEFVDGLPFLDAVARPDAPSAPIDRVIELGSQLLDVLARLHAAGLAHRDIKPSNVLVDDRDHVKVLDFGIGEFFDRMGQDTESGQVVGTMPYMAPEQLAGFQGDEQVDIFATGLMIYEALTQPRPEPGTSLGWVTRTCLERLPPLAAVRPDVPRRLSRVVERLLHIDPRHRPSASVAAARLKEVRSLPDSQDWPEPPFVEPGDWWDDLEGALGDSTRPFLWVLEGTAGSGRRRVVEQLQREGLLRGIRTLHVRCDVTRIGGPVCQALEAVLGTGENEAQIKEMVGPGGGALRQMWPHLPVPPSTQQDAVPTTTRIAQAAAFAITKFASTNDLLLVFHQVEQIDLLSARALIALANKSDRSLGVVLLHDPRWETPLSKEVITEFRRLQHARMLSIPVMDAMTADAVRAATCPQAPPTGGACSPQRAVEEGYAQLAEWRDEDWEPPSPNLWPLAVIEPIPTRVLTELVGPSIEASAWVRPTQAGVVLAGATARRAARSRLASLSGAAAAIAETWETVEGVDAKPEALAQLHLLAGQPDRALPHVVRAALRAREDGRYANARRWLFLHDMLSDASVPVAFNIALARAEVALVTEAEELRVELVEVCEAAATDEHERVAASIVRASYQLRNGDVRSALVAALRIASPNRAPTPDLASRALMLACRCRLRLGQVADAQAQLTRAEALISRGAPSYMGAGLALLRAEVLLATEDLDAAGAQAEALFLQAKRKGHLHESATAGLVLAKVLRLVGRRSRAESLARGAAQDAATAGDLSLEAEARLHLAVLLIERGDATSGRPHLDASIRRFRGLHDSHALPRALRAVLQAAIAEDDARDADLALAPGPPGIPVDPELAPVTVRWWRLRGDISAALAVSAPPEGTWAHLVWKIERARAHMTVGNTALASHEAGQARLLAYERGFDEVELYARLVEQAANPSDERGWGETCNQAASSLWTDLCFCALELQAKHLERRGRSDEARSVWEALQARSEELGYRPGAQEAALALGRYTDPATGQ